MATVAITVLIAVVAHAWARLATVSLRARIAYLELELNEMAREGGHVFERGRKQGHADATAEWKAKPLYVEGYQRGIGEAAEIQAEMDMMRQSGQLERTV